MCVDAHGVEDLGQLVHEGDVDVALRVLDNLGSLSHLDAWGFMCAVDEDAVVDGIHVIGNLGRGA